MTNNKPWVFLPQEKKLYHFGLNHLIDTRMSELILLPKYESEDFDCYEIKDSNNSKIFVQQQIVKAVQAGKSFFYQQTEFIYNHKNVIFNLLGKPDNEENNVLYYEKLKLTIYCLDNQTVRWVTVDCW